MRLAALRPALFISLLLVGFLSGCGSNTGTLENSPAAESTSDSADELISRALGAEGNELAELLLSAAELMQESGGLQLSTSDIADVSLSDISDSSLRFRTAILLSEQLLAANRSDSALDLLLDLDRTQATAVQQQTLELLTGNAYAALGDTDSALDAYLIAADLAPLTQSLSDYIWLTLGELSAVQLESLASSAASYQLRGWIELARIYRNNPNSLRAQLDAVEQWQRIWAQHAAVNRLPSVLVDLASAWEQRPRQIALLLPLQQPAGLAIQEGILKAYYDALRETREVPRITVYDTGSASDIRPLYSQAIEEGADLVIGPLSKEFVNRLHSQSDLPVPTLALNYADSELPGPANLFQFGLAPEDEINQAAKIAWQQGYRNAALLTPNSADYQRLQSAFSQTWAELGGLLVSQSEFRGDGDYAEVVKRLMAIDSSENRADRLLELLPRNSMEFIPRRRSDIDFIFLIANPRQGRQIKPTLSFYFAQDVPVFSLPSINDGLENPSANQDLDGIIFTDAPWLLDRNTASRAEMDASLRPAQGPLQRLRALGVDSYRLHARLFQFESGAIASVPGTTGVLSITADRRIHRRLQPAYFDNGIAQPLAMDLSQQAD